MSLLRRWEFCLPWRFLFYKKFLIGAGLISISKTLFYSGPYECTLSQQHLSVFLSLIFLPYRCKQLPIQQKVNEIFFHFEHYQQKYPCSQWQIYFYFFLLGMADETEGIFSADPPVFLSFGKSLFCREKSVNHAGNLFPHLTFTASPLSIIRILREGMKILRQRMMGISALVNFCTCRSQTNGATKLNIYSYEIDFNSSDWIVLDILSVNQWVRSYWGYLESEESQDLGNWSDFNAHK